VKSGRPGPTDLKKNVRRSPRHRASCCRPLAGPLVLCLLSGDEERVRTLLDEARGPGVDTALLARDVIAPALEEIGEMWRRRQISPAEEHLATSVLSRALGHVGTRVPLPPLGAPRILFACLAGEFHELGIRIAADVAHEAGWLAKSLGANVPRGDLALLVEERRPDAVGLSVALAAHLPECLRTIDEIRRRAPGVKILVGGRAVRTEPALRTVKGPDACAADAVELRDWLTANRPHTTSCSPVLPQVARDGRCHLPESLRRRIRRGSRAQ